MRSKLLIILFLCLFNYAPSAQAQGGVLACLNAIKQTLTDQLSSYKKHEDPFKQLVVWELRENMSAARDTISKIPVPYTTIPKKDAAILSTSLTDPELLKLFISGDKIKYPLHPFNKEPSVPFFTNNRSPELFKGNLSASRSIYFGNNNKLYSIKMGTDHPHKGLPQEGKTETAEDIASALAKSEHIQKVDSILGDNKEFTILHDVLAIIHPEDLGGFLIRDLTPLQDGYYYLPALSIPYVGDSIARMHNANFEEFWTTHYIDKLAKSLALMLIKYGIIMDTPNSQNFLIQMTKDYMPTGKIMIRDIGDSSFVLNVADFINPEVKNLQEKYNFDFEFLNKITSNSHFYITFWSKSFLDSDVIGRMEEAGRKKFFETIISELNLDVSYQPKKRDTAFSKESQHPVVHPQNSTFLEKIKNWHTQQLQKNKPK